LNAVGGKGGNVNIFGSSLFNLGFNQMWEADGFSPYIVMGPAAAGAAEEDSEETKKGEGEVFKLKAGGAKAKRKSAWEVDDLQLGSKEVEENDGDDSSGITLKMSDLQTLFKQDKTLTDVVHGWIEDMLDAKTRASLSRRS
jgi:hypothetical protein